MLDSMDKRILVVEDQRDIAELIAMHLRDLGHRVDCVHDGAGGYEAARSGRYDLVVLDVMLPVRDGLDVVRALRMEKVTTPVLMLTARSTELDRVLGLELGADDYLTKPFSIPELQARVKAMLRRVDMQAPAARAAKCGCAACRSRSPRRNSTCCSISRGTRAAPSRACSCSTPSGAPPSRATSTR
jgi:DNA-binding response OmpR family regulator